jgi:hypothetical protein
MNFILKLIELNIKFQVPLRENRETGENPVRTQHCEDESFAVPLAYAGKG